MARGGLLNSLGLESCTNPKAADPNWGLFERIISANPQLAKSNCSRGGICSPLNLAICNEHSPVPPDLVEKLIIACPSALTDDSFALACGNTNLHIDVLKTMLYHNSNLLNAWNLRQVAFKSNTKFAKYIICNHKDVLPSTCGGWSLIYGNTIQAFWLRHMIEFDEAHNFKAGVISFSHIVGIKLTHYFAAHSNVEAIQMLVKRNPLVLSSKNMGRLPIHEAISNYSGRIYGWDPKLVRYLLQEGSRYQIGEENGGLGGLFVPDEKGMTPFASCMELVRDHISFSSHDPEMVFGEKWDCLIACIEFLNLEWGGDVNDSIFYAALNVIPLAVDLVDLIIDRYGMDAQNNGKRAIDVAVTGTLRALKSTNTMGNVEVLEKTGHILFDRLLGGSYKGSGKHLVWEKDKNGRTPLVKAAASGLQWSQGLSAIFDANRGATEDTDFETGLYPFLLAAMEKEVGADLDATWIMLKCYVGPLL